MRDPRHSHRKNEYKVNVKGETEKERENIKSTGFTGSIRLITLKRVWTFSANKKLRLKCVYLCMGVRESLLLFLLFFV